MSNQTYYADRNSTSQWFDQILTGLRIHRSGMYSLFIQNNPNTQNKCKKSGWTNSATVLKCFFKWCKLDVLVYVCRAVSIMKSIPLQWYTRLFGNFVRIFAIRWCYGPYICISSRRVRVGSCTVWICVK